ncbi:MAG: zinc-dependent metalloprotease [Actinomycetota bacterium]
MDDPGSAQPPEVPFGELFNEVPLFREIQRVLLAGSGPINWELARQVGIAMASWGRDDPAPTEDDRKGLEDTVRAAELHVAELTGLEPPPGIGSVEVCRRAQWVETAIQDLKEIVAPAAVRVADAFTKAQMGEVPAEAAQVAQGVLGQLSPLLLGAQAGTVLGSLAQKAFGNHDISAPRPASGRLSFVAANIAQFERDWSVQPMEFRAWVALHEVVHRFQFARPWAYPHLRSLVEDYVSTLEIDVDAIREQLERLDPSDPEALQGLLGEGSGLFGSTLDPDQRIKLERVQAFVAAVEGHGDHVTGALGRTMLSSSSRIEEAVARSREDDTDDPFFERLLGIEMKRDLHARGRTFCERVVEQTDESTLSRMWGSAESLPSLPELDEPTLWLSRIV